MIVYFKYLLSVSAVDIYIYPYTHCGITHVVSRIPRTSHAPVFSPIYVYKYTQVLSSLCYFMEK